MVLENVTDIDNRAFVLGGNPLYKDQTVLQDGGRSGNMLYGTVMSRVAASGKWVPFTDEAAADGTQIPKGILLAELTEADIQAGDIENVPIMIGNATLDQEQLTIENSKTLATVVNTPAGINSTVEELLRWVGIFTAATILISEPYS